MARKKTEAASTLTKAEEQVMQALWSIGEGFAGDIAAAVAEPRLRAGRGHIEGFWNGHTTATVDRTYTEPLPSIHLTYCTKNMHNFSLSWSAASRPPMPTTSHHSSPTARSTSRSASPCASARWNLRAKPALVRNDRTHCRPLLFHAPSQLAFCQSRAVGENKGRY